MPTYSYKCTECENAFDVQQAFTDDSLTTCPVCEGTLRKVFNSIGVTFNGSGFYRTDSRASARKEHGNRSKEPASKPSESKPSGSKPSESKPSGSTSSSTTPSPAK